MISSVFHSVFCSSEVQTESVQKNRRHFLASLSLSPKFGLSERLSKRLMQNVKLPIVWLAIMEVYYIVGLQRVQLCILHHFDGHVYIHAQAFTLLLNWYDNLTFSVISKYAYTLWGKNKSDSRKIFKWLQHIRSSVSNFAISKWNLVK